MVRSRPATVNCRAMESPAGEPVYTVSQLNREARLLLERSFPALWISGELSNLARPASGHLYFSLKDEQAQVRCALFRGAARSLRFRPENGQQVLARARIGLYEPRGDYQLIVEHMEPAGDGLLLRRLEELKQRLAAEGLFDAARKRALPALPRRIGVVTSPSGAAIHDILKILRRRFPAVPVVIYPTPVQGEAARAGIVAAIASAGARAECDVLILARGGGSLEDLWCFNEEAVARAIVACPIPVISGVGHETDFTLADLAADLRAPTPSGAAEHAVPEGGEWLARSRELERRAQAGMGRRLEQLAQAADGLGQRLARMHPALVLQQHARRLAELRARSGRALPALLRLRRLETGHLLARLSAATPATLLASHREQLDRQRERLLGALRLQLAAGGQRLAVAAAALQAYSPLQTLERGYAIVTEAASGRVIRRATEVDEGTLVSARLAEGAIEARVLRKLP